MTKRGVVQLVIAAFAAVGCVRAWLRASSYAEVAPVIDGEPSTTSVIYDAPMLTLSLLLATVAGVCLVLGVANLRRRRRRADSPYG